MEGKLLSDNDLLGNPVKIGLIGCGGVMQVAHIPAYQRQIGVTVVSVCDLDERLAADAAARLRTGSWTTNVNELLMRKDIEAVHIATGSLTHPMLIKTALAAGKHVLVEKPISDTPEQAREVHDVAESAGLVFMVGFNRRHDPVSEKIKACLSKEGVMPKHIICIRTRTNNLGKHSLIARGGPVLRSQAIPRVSENENIRPPYVSTQLMASGIHQLDLIRYFCGEVKRVIYARLLSGYDYHVVLELQSGILGTLIGTTGIADEKEVCEIHGEGISIEASYGCPYETGRSSLLVWDNGDRTIIGIPSENQYYRQLKHFAACVRGQAIPSATSWDGVRSIELVSEAWNVSSKYYPMT